MSLNLWNQADIQRILLALTSAGRSNGSEYIKALQDVGLAFGMADPGRPTEIVDVWCEMGDNGRGEVLALDHS